MTKTVRTNLIVLGAILIAVLVGIVSEFWWKPMVHWPGLSPTQSAFGSPVYFNLGESFVYEDGLKATLESIDDSRCKEGNVCIWEGELAPTFIFTGGDLGASSTEVRLGTSRTKEGDLNIYHLTLVSATETSATIIVSCTSLVCPKPR